MNNNTTITGESVSKTKKLRSILMRVSVWTFVAGVAITAVLIVTEAMSSAWQLSSTVFVIALIMLIGVNGFYRLEDEHKAVRVLAGLGLVTSVIWGILAMLLIWGLLELMDHDYYSIPSSYSIAGKIFIMVGNLAGLGVIGSNILAIKEYDKKNVIKPLKITALVCLGYVELYSIITTLAGVTMQMGGLNALAAFASFIWVVSVIIAVVLSHRFRSEIAQKNNNMMMQNMTPPGVMGQGAWWSQGGGIPGQGMPQGTMMSQGSMMMSQGGMVMSQGVMVSSNNTLDNIPMTDGIPAQDVMTPSGSAPMSDNMPAQDMGVNDAPTQDAEAFQKAEIERQVRLEVERRMTQMQTNQPTDDQIPQQ